MSRNSDFNKGSVNARQVAKAAEEGKAKKQHISNDTPLDFPKNTESGFITNHELAEDINKVMENLFSDFYGSVVSVVPMQAGPSAIKVDLFFRPSNAEVAGDQIKAFVSLQDPAQNGGSLIDKIRLTNKLAAHDRNFEITSEAAEILYDFLPANVQKNIAWDRPETFVPLYSETVEPQQFGAPVIYCSIEVDIFKVLSFIYGNTVDNKKYGSRLTYNIVPVRPASNTIDPTVIGANWILQLSVMSYDAWEEVMKKLGFNFNQGRTPIIVSRRNRA